MNKRPTKETMKKFKEQMKMHLDIDAEGQGPKTLSERRQCQIKWCQQQRLKLMKEYNDLIEARNSLDKLQDEQLELSKWILQMKTNIMKQMTQGECDNPTPSAYSNPDKPGSSYMEVDTDNNEDENFEDESENIGLVNPMKKLPFDQNRNKSDNHDNKNNGDYGGNHFNGENHGNVGTEFNRDNDSNHGSDGDRGNDSNHGSDGDRGNGSNHGSDGDRGNDSNHGSDGDRGNDSNHGSDGDRGNDSNHGSDGDRGNDSNHGSDGDRGNDSNQLEAEHVKAIASGFTFGPLNY